ncbi:hypothetical protein D3C72_2337160 [compost metagenome]
MGIDPGIDNGAQPLANIRGRAGVTANGEGPGVRLLLQVAGCLVDPDVALVLRARIVDGGVINDGGLGEGRCTAKHGDHQQRTIHLNGLPL